jgi:hypothetical protein
MIKNQSATDSENKWKICVINYKSLMVIPCIYESIENIYDTKWIYRKENNKYGVVNSENKLVENIEYDDFKIIKNIYYFQKIIKY